MNPLISKLGDSLTAEIGLESPGGPRTQNSRAISLRMTVLAGVGDLVIFFAAFIGFLALENTSQAPAPLLVRLGIGGLVTYFLIARTCGAFDAKYLLRQRYSAIQVLRASAFWTVAAAITAWVVDLPAPLHPLSILQAGAVATFGAVLWRLLFHGMIKRGALAGQLSQRILFVGWSSDAFRVTRLIWQAHGDLFEVVGYVAVDSEQVSGEEVPNVPFHGSWEYVAEIIREQTVDIVVLADVHTKREVLSFLAETCEKEIVRFHIIPEYFSILRSGLSVERVGGVPLLGISKLPLDHVRNRVIKRTLDIIGALVGLTLAAPFIAVFGALIYLESPGSIFFWQERIGQRGGRFRMCKLRSMRLDAAAKDHLQQSTLRNDPRVLRVGAFMRRWNIDEIPQFWNVLVGDMTLVGPRPERTFHSQKLRDEIPHYNARYFVKPGITGWAQVCGLRGDTDLTKRIQADLFYMENWSPWLDLEIMITTFLKRENAY